MKDRLPSYGGQAVIEGVLMRGKTAVAMATRAPNNEIVFHQEKLSGIYKSNLLKIPFLRGLIVLWDALSLGMRFLTISANVQTGEDEKLEGPLLYFTLATSLLIGIGLFFLLPAFISGLVARYFVINAWMINLLEGLLRLTLLVSYLWMIGKFPDIKRVFMYHGAEHKTINAFEAGADLNANTVVDYSLEHPRCGTSFILTLVLFSIILFSLFGPLPFHMRLLSRILMIPVLAGISYEYIHLLAKYSCSPVVKWLMKPNLALQKLTTREPSLEMLEVSIEAFNLMFNLENEYDPALIMTI